MQIFFSILGHLTAELRPAEPGARPIELDVGPFKQRLLLALLLCRCDTVVPVGELIDGLWWEGPPRTAHKTIQVYISHLRKLLAADGQPERLLHRSSGYQIALGPAEVDALQFEDLSRAGRLALRRGDARAAAASSRQALGLWRGPALAGLHASPALREEAARLDHRRLSAYEDWFEAELLLGNHAEVLAEIDAVVRAHPLRERLRSHQLTALCRGGRQAEALAEYDNLRQMLTSELGLDPSPALQQLYQSMLSGHPALAVPLPTAGGGLRESPDSGGSRFPQDAVAQASGEVVAHLSAHPWAPGTAGGLVVRRARGSPAGPAGLPRAVDDFTGRRDVLGPLLAFFGDGSSATPYLRRLAVVVGPPGAGTTTLALQAAHAIAANFRDGQVLLPCREADGRPRPPAELIDDLLDLLQPFPWQPLAARDPSVVLRGRLAGLQMLLILDDVAEEAQVRPLLPGTGDCSVIITSCRTLSGLDGVGRFPLGLFTEDEGLSLLSRLVGAERISSDPPAALRIVRACGLLPLAVRIAGARLAALEHLPLERFATRLEDERRLLDELAIGDLSLRDRFDHYLQGLDTAERLALMLVAAAWGPSSSGVSGMEQLLERLAGVHALTITDRDLRSMAGPRPFSMPTPLWAYARQLVSAAVGDASPDRGAQPHSHSANS
jgi:DNA-binding SARP family transcriptional activator